MSNRASASEVLAYIESAAAKVWLLFPMTVEVDGEMCVIDPHKALDEISSSEEAELHGLKFCHSCDMKKEEDCDTCNNWRVVILSASAGGIEAMKKIQNKHHVNLITPDTWVVCTKALNKGETPKLTIIDGIGSPHG